MTFGHSSSTAKNWDSSSYVTFVFRGSFWGIEGIPHCG